MTKPLRLSLALAACLVAASAPALSQTLELGTNGLRVLPDDRRGPDYDRDRRPPPPPRGPPPGISEREAARIARSEGMREIDDVFRQRRTVRVEGADRRGYDMTVILDARTGDVIDVR
ncbi:PepSY domain-containing protein [Aureimonas flava]|uniref:PepSY domain-containing protein n=1 Tax=Aureimonas flava TaxID=2320271 RepID=A0A3A1WHU5_9HYPH|nr:PepSY domain-containing protein [Aureimonas flava]RIY00163.1 PepSY domain-containing protein [Aureimonas flava]